MLWNPIPDTEAFGLTLHVAGEGPVLWRNDSSHITADPHSEQQGPKTALHVLYLEDKQT